MYDDGWATAYKQNFQKYQQWKQHHVHTLNAKGERVPLTHCKRLDKPSCCKAEFPKDKWLCSSGCVLCPAFMKQMDMPTRGKTNRIGASHGPRNDAWLNGTCPAVLTGLPGCNSNSDVQPPYRFPITTATHSPDCHDVGCTQTSGQEMIRAAQQAQNAQAWYACDYQNKRLPRSFNEVK